MGVRILKELWEETLIQWKEWMTDRRSRAILKRDMRQYNYALERAKKKSLMDGKTYYIVRDKAMNINELNSNEIKFWKSKEVVDFKNHLDLLERCIAIVKDGETTYVRKKKEEEK